MKAIVITYIGTTAPDSLIGDIAQALCNELCIAPAQLSISTFDDSELVNLCEKQLIVKATDTNRQKQHELKNACTYLRHEFPLIGSTSLSLESAIDIAQNIEYSIKEQGKVGNNMTKNAVEIVLKYSQGDAYKYGINKAGYIILQSVKKYV